MKTTIEINDTLLEEIKNLAHREGCSMKSLLEEGLHEVLRSRSRAHHYVWRDASIPGALTAEAANMTWQEILDHSRGDRL
ncbi:MAG: DUF2191 domain-containing protein [Actinobacteria bacterium]|nr:DUF2191 domain-containing protein [Actinomycetota bacterium]